MENNLLIDIEGGHKAFECPGCGCSHYITDTWNIEWKNNLLTVSPSVLVDKDRPERRCHLFIKNSQIQYLTDCHHKLKGQTVDMIPY